MRTALALAVILLAACASEKLALAPPAGVDFSGTWKLNEADSDDPQRLLQNQTGPGKAKTSNGGTTGGPPGGGGPSGGGGRGGKRSGRSSSGARDADSPPPSTATIRLLGSNLQWPGKDLRIKQDAGIVELASENTNRIYRPVSAKRHAPASADHGVTRGRDGLPPLCGWSGKTLVVMVADSDDGHPVEQHFSIAEDGRRLVEVVGVKGHMDGFTMSRIWDRVP
jgi:hypothetical protein